MWLMLNILAGLMCADAGRTIEASEIKQIVRQYIFAHVDTADASIDIEFRSLPTRVMNIPESGGVRIAHAPQKRLRGNVILAAEVFSDARVEHTFLVSVKIREYRSILKAAGRISKGTRGETVLVEGDKVESTNLTGELITSHAQLAGMRAKRIIKAGAILTTDMFEPVPVINQGRTVKLIVRTGSVMITTSAIAREDGGPGSMVLVQKEGTGERLRARVVDEETVELLTSN